MSDQKLSDLTDTGQFLSASEMYIVQGGVSRAVSRGVIAAGIVDALDTGDLGARRIGVADTGGLYVSGNVEHALAEVMAAVEVIESGLADAESDIDAIEADYLDSSDIGLQTIYVPASAMVPAVTNGPAVGQIEQTTNGHNSIVLDFDASTDELACFELEMPKSYDGGVINFKGHWTTSASDTDGVAIALQAVSIADGDSMDVAYGTAVVVTDDAQSAANDVLITALSGDVTIAGSPAAGERVQFWVFRDVSDAADDMTEDMRLIGITILYNTDALRDN